MTKAADILNQKVTSLKDFQNGNDLNLLSEQYCVWYVELHQIAWSKILHVLKLCYGG
jgi:hypothetical protein